MPIANVDLGNGRSLAIRKRSVGEKRAYFSAWERKRQSQWRTRILMFMGGKCEHCDNNDARVLQIDHVNSDGAKDRRENGVASAFGMARRVFANPSRFQLLCANCNWIKRYTNNEFGAKCANGGAL